ncbi:MAG TPA: tail fiber domain-containing protein [Candidatus Sulfotelmatobacter sp.]|jgi:hypothetical protein|nr:tail fiber domain-containing protein [Candidatus Sulfotelmatobacter sp.]
MQRVLIVIISALLVLSSLAGEAQQSTTSDPQHRQVSLPPATVTGSGTVNYVPLWTGTTTLGNSIIYQSSGKVGVNKTSPLVELDVTGRINSSKAFQLGGVDMLTSPGATSTNIAVGWETLQNATSSTSYNTALGAMALQNTTSATENTGIGASALLANTTGAMNTAVGALALGSNTISINNTALGVFALRNNTMGTENTATGWAALDNNLTGNDNTACGGEALAGNTTGTNNVALGYRAANSVSGSNSNNIHIGSIGVSTDNGTIRIGTTGTQTELFEAGIYGVTTALDNALPVLIDGHGQLGTTSSSRRYKEDIHDMGDSSKGLMRLRPVTFRYQKPFADGSKSIQYGLIAEEVAEVFPDLVVRSTDGQIEAVKYQLLDPMLLNEVQRQEKEIESLKERLEKMEAALASAVHELGGKQVSSVAGK